MRRLPLLLLLAQGPAWAAPAAHEAQPAVPAAPPTAAPEAAPSAPATTPDVPTAAPTAAPVAQPTPGAQPASGAEPAPPPDVEPGPEAGAGDPAEGFTAAPEVPRPPALTSPAAPPAPATGPPEVAPPTAKPPREAVSEPDDPDANPFGGPHLRFSMLGAGVTSPTWTVAPRNVPWSEGPLGRIDSEQLLGARLLLAPGLVADMNGWALRAWLGPTLGVLGEQSDRDALSQSIDLGMAGFEARIAAMAPIGGADSLGVTVAVAATWAFTGAWTVDGSGLSSGGVVEERVFTPDVTSVELLVMPTWSRYGGQVGVGLSVQHLSVDPGIGPGGAWSDWFVGVAVSGGYAFDL